MDRETTWQVLRTPPKPVKVRAADCRKKQRLRLRRDDAVKAWVNEHALE
jgi:hypothetical protein